MNRGGGGTRTPNRCVRCGVLLFLTFPPARRSCSSDSLSIPQQSGHVPFYLGKKILKNTFLSVWIRPRVFTIVFFTRTAGRRDGFPIVRYRRRARNILQTFTAECMSEKRTPKISSANPRRQLEIAQLLTIILLQYHTDDTPPPTSPKTADYRTTLSISRRRTLSSVFSNFLLFRARLINRCLNVWPTRWTSRQKRKNNSERGRTNSCRILLQ